MSKIKILEKQIKLDKILSNNRWKISSIEDLTSPLCDSIRIQFSNEYELSVITGPYSYGGKSGLYEIAAINKFGDFDGSILNIEKDDVLGFLTLEDVFDVMDKINVLE